MNLIKPEIDLQHILLNVLMPGRYVGGEFGSIQEFNETDFHFGISFPDLYEIGMSNQAIKLLYRGLNKIEGISCERVFAPAQDFEKELKQNKIPLYTLENGIPLNQLDMLGFSIGFELSATNILTILETGQIPVLKKDRDNSAPVIIAGGPAITNPAPFSPFLDAVYLGEAEDEFYKLIKTIAINKNNGATRKDIIGILAASPFIWMDNKTSSVSRSIWNGFNTFSTGSIPIASISTVQDNGIIEIMRGCPNSCRFCHAASFYRPYRQKEHSNILKEVDFLVKDCGYNELTLSSLSSGDYSGLDKLIEILNKQYVSKNISFSLPSLRINSFTLPLLKELSKVRKSGLTFAIETPEDLWRKSINKEVDTEKIINILIEAKEMGWKLAKFYFMIGLPGTDRSTESDKIISFIDNVQKRTGMKLNVNVGTFIPKAHTPFQWSPQLSDTEAYSDMRKMKMHFKRNGNVKLSYHSTFVSFVEGVLSRGDERVADLIISAYKKGARLDAWEEHFDTEIWKEVFSEADWDVESEITRERSLDEKFPWDNISLGITKPYLKKEYKKSINYETTKICDDPCDHNCGVCIDNKKVEKVKKSDIVNSNFKEVTSIDSTDSFSYIIEFSKSNKAIYLSHLNIVNVFSMALRRSGVNIKFTNGFNPKPKLEFAHPLSLGIISRVEIMSVVLSDSIPEKDFLENLNLNLPSGIKVSRCSLLPERKSIKKRKSLMSLYGGSEYLLENHSNGSSEFFEKFNNYRDRENLSNLHTELADRGLVVRIDNNGRKDSNIFYHIDKIIDRKEFYKNFSLKRTRLYTVSERKGYYELLF